MIAIHTRSGHIIKFTEEESIIITDKSENEIHLDTIGSNINITAPETMTLNAKNMVINVGENMTTSVGVNQAVSVGMNSTTGVGMLNSLNVGGDNRVLVTGQFIETVQGDLISEVQKERMESSFADTVMNSEVVISQHAQKQVNNNSS